MSVREKCYNISILGIGICFLMTVALFSFDIYYPSMPDIAAFFHVTPSKIQLSVSCYFLPLAFSQLLFGPLSNFYGRRKMLLAGTLFALVGSLICYVSSTAEEFIFGRFTQGIGVGAYYTLTRAIMRDVFEGAKLARFNSLISAVLSLSPCLAPVLGSYFHTYCGWRSNFLFLFVLFCFAFLMICSFLPETNKFLSKEKKLLGDFSGFLRNRIFINYLLCSTLAYSGLVIFLTMAPFIFESELLLSPIQFSVVTLCVMVGLTFGALANSQLVMKFSLNNLIVAAGFLMVFSGSLLFLLTEVFSRNPITITIPCVFFAVACNIIFSNAGAGALTPIDKKSIGTGSALFGCIQILGPAIASALISLIHFDYVYVLAVSYLMIGTIVLCLLAKIRQMGCL